MKLFYAQLNNNQFELMEDEARHLQKVIRIKDGENIVVTNGLGYWAEAQIVYFGKKIALKHSDIQIQHKSNPNELHIAIAPTKNMDRIEFFIEKSCEMDIAEISFILCDQSERKLLNMEKIKKQVIAACKQSLRFHFPKINEITSLHSFIQQQSADNTYVAHCDSGLHRLDLHEIAYPEKSTFLVGPEGDFSPKEIQMLQEKGIKAIRLGYQRLRTETAGLFIAAWAYQNNL